MANVLFPLSGDVTQSINPWTWFTKVVSGQIGLVNINLGRSSAPDLEREILDEVGSYGKQLGRIGDALAAILHNVDTSKWSDESKAAVHAFERQLEDIQKIKTKHKATAAP